MLMICLDKTKEADLFNALKCCKPPELTWKRRPHRFLEEVRSHCQATYVEDEERKVDTMDDDDDYNDKIDTMEDSLSVPSGDTDIYRLMEVETMMMKEGENVEPEKQEEVNEVKSTDEPQIPQAQTTDSSLLLGPPMETTKLEELLRRPHKQTVRTGLSSQTTGI